MEKENTERKKSSRYKLRSSLKKSTKNSQGNSDISDEGEDMTLPPPPRRVSFAASSTVKPFVNDPEKNTIWDMTYEEEINHTDSGNVISTDIITNIRGTMGIDESMVACDEINFNINEVFKNVEDTPVPKSLIFADSIQCQELLVEEKENVYVFATRTKRSRSLSNRSLKARKPIKSLAYHTETLTEPCDMSLTCRFDPPGTHTETILGSCDMSLTCQFNVPNKSLRAPNPLMETVLEPADMELTCQFKTPQIYISKEPVNETNSSRYEDDMEFTCMPTRNPDRTMCPISCDPIPYLSRAEDEMEFTCIPTRDIDQSNDGIPRANTNLSQSKDYMEFTCQNTSQTVTNTNPSSGDCKAAVFKLVTDKTIDMDNLDRSICPISSDPIPNLSRAECEMEFTCIPTRDIDQSNDGIPRVNTNLSQSKDDMEFTCQNTSQTVTNTNASSEDFKAAVSKLFTDKTMDMDNLDRSICPISSDPIPNLSRAEDAMEFPCIPTRDIDKSVYGIPRGNTNLSQSKDDMEITCQLQRQTVTNTNTSPGDFKAAVSELKDETIDDLIGTLTSIIDENSFDQNTPPKIVYSQPREIKPSDSTLDFTMPSSSKTRMDVHSIGSIDGTQQLLQATILKSFFLQEKSGSTLSPSRTLNASNIRSQRILDEIEQHLVPYQHLEKYDHEGLDREINEADDVLKKIRKQLEEFAPFEPPLESEYDKLMDKILTGSKDIFQESSSDDGSYDENSAPEPWWQNLHQKILEVFNSTEEEILNLEDSNEKECYYVFSTFSRMVWFAVDLLSKDGVVIDIKSLSALDDSDCKSLNRTLYEFIVKDTQHKMQMCSLKSSLGSTFDMLTLLDHVKIITEKNFNFYLYYRKIQSKHASLRITGDGEVSFQILCTPNPRILWKLAFKLASVEKIEQGSLTATSEFDGTIRLDHLNIILRNIEPGLDCIGRFIDEVLVYFKRTQLGKHKTKGEKTEQTVPVD